MAAEASDQVSATAAGVGTGPGRTWAQLHGGPERGRVGKTCLHRASGPDLGFLGPIDLEDQIDHCPGLRGGLRGERLGRPQTAPSTSVPAADVPGLVLHASWARLSRGSGGRPT